MEQNQNNKLVLSKDFEEVSEKLNESVVSVIGNETMNGFKKAYLVANAIENIKGLLTTQYMTPILALQGNKLGFKTDKDNAGGYPPEVVKNCLIEAVLFGLQPYGNQFNIIAGNMYATKEGLGFLLSKIEGLSYDIVPELPRVSADQKSAAIVMNLNWSYKNVKQSKRLEIPIKSNSFVGTDGIIGKATRKARKWLFDTITGSEVPEGDAVDADYTTISSKQNGNAVDQFAEEEKIKIEVSPETEQPNKEEAPAQQETKPEAPDTPPVTPSLKIAPNQDSDKLFS